jgi:uncharacterized phage protein gp47/JayE
MTLTRPTLTTIISRIEDDIESAVSSDAPLMSRSVLRVLARVFGAAVHLSYGYADWIAKQIFPDTAETGNLEQWAAIWGIYRKNATFTTAQLAVTGTAGSTIPEDTQWTASDGTEFTTTADAGIGTDGTGSISIESEVAGTVANLTSGQTLSLVNPISGTDSSGTVSSASLSNGIDSETDTSLLDRLLTRIQQAPQGGCANDYVTWAKATADVDVTRAWAYENYLGAGTVGVTFAVDDDTSGPIPTAAQVTLVAAEIEDNRPLCADVTVFAPTAYAIDMTVTISPSTSALKTSVETALNDYILDAGYPGGTIYLSKLLERVASVSGITDCSITTPTANISVAKSQLAALRTITWA